VFRRYRFLVGAEPGDAELPDAWWFREDGFRMTQKDWNEGELALGLFLSGEAIGNDRRGRPVHDDSFLLLFNATGEDREFTLPRSRMGNIWALELATAEPAVLAGSRTYDAQAQLTMPSRSIAVLKRVS
jgi:glycogen operon protein